MHRQIFISIWVPITLLLAGCVPAVTPPPPTPLAAPTGTSEPSPTHTPSATATSLPTDMPKRTPGPFTLYGDSPIIERGPEGAWDSKYVYPVGVAVAQGTFYLFRRGLESASGIEGTGYATSSDGFAWSRASEMPVFTGEGSDMEPPGANPTDVRIEDGRWIMTFWGAPAGQPRTAAIWQATATQPDGPWTVDRVPLLERGSSGEWDGSGVHLPSVVRTEAGWMMFFDGFNLGQDRDTDHIGMATSADGRAWKKYNDPATGDHPYRDSDPVFGPGEPGTWDERSVQQPEVVLTPDGIIMVYWGMAEGDRRASLGLARSQDGITWERHPANPVIIREDVPGADFLHTHHLFYYEHTYFLFVEVGEAAHTDIWLFVFEGTLDW